MYPMIENPWVVADFYDREREPEPLEECEYCGMELFYGDKAYVIGDKEEYYCEDCLREDEYESGTCSCCKHDHEYFEVGEKIYKTRGGKKWFCWECVEEITLDEDEYDFDY